MNLPLIPSWNRSLKTVTFLYSMLILLILAVALFMVLAHNGVIGEHKNKDQQSEQMSTSSETIAIAGENGGENMQLEVETEDMGGAEAVVVKTGWFVYENFKLGHNHLNGQSLVFITLAVLFAFSTASAGMKTILSSGLFLSVILHTVGLFFRQYGFFEMLLIIGGSGFSIAAFLMTVFILKDLPKSE